MKGICFSPLKPLPSPRIPCSLPDNSSLGEDKEAGNLCGPPWTPEQQRCAPREGGILSKGIGSILACQAPQGEERGG